MKIFLDTEFIEDGYSINPISIGLVREDDLEYYAENSNINLLYANKFVKEMVIPNLKCYDEKWPNYLSSELGAKSKYQIANDMLEFCGEKPEFWGYFCDYDWVLICQLFGNMINLPSDKPYNWPFYCLDLRQEMHMYNITKEIIEKEYPQPTTHNALDDARWIRDAARFLGIIRRKPIVSKYNPYNIKKLD